MSSPLIGRPSSVSTSAKVPVHVLRQLVLLAPAAVGLLEALQEPTRIRRYAHQVGALLQGVEVVTRHQDCTATPRGDLHRCVVIVDLLDEREEVLARLARRDRHGHHLRWYLQGRIHDDSETQPAPRMASRSSVAFPQATGTEPARSTAATSSYIPLRSR
jgi:hypothetical protein